MIGVMEEEDVEVIGVAAFEAFGGGRFEELGVPVGAAEFGIGEAGVAFGAFSFSVIEVVTEEADEAVGIAGDIGEGFPQGGIGFAGAIDIGGDKGADSFFVGALEELDEPVFVDCLAEVHEASAVPGAIGCVSGMHFLEVGNQGSGISVCVSVDTFRRGRRCRQAGL